MYPTQAKHRGHQQSPRGKNFYMEGAQIVASGGRTSTTDTLRAEKKKKGFNTVVTS